jgi:plastocyanin
MESDAGVMTKALLATLAVLALTGVACGGGGGSDCTSQNATTLTGTLTVKDFAFNPDCFSVASGSTISVANEDFRGHNFTVEDTDVAVRLLPGETGEATAPAPGTYDFECTFHPGMKGTIIVT